MYCWFNCLLCPPREEEDNRSNVVSVESSFKIMKEITYCVYMCVYISKVLLEVFLLSSILTLLSFIGYRTICNKNMNNRLKYLSFFWKTAIKNKYEFHLKFQNCPLTSLSLSLPLWWGYQFWHHWINFLLEVFRNMLCFYFSSDPRCFSRDIQYAFIFLDKWYF